MVQVATAVPYMRGGAPEQIPEEKLFREFWRYSGAASGALQGNDGRSILFLALKWLRDFLNSYFVNKVLRQK